MNHLDKLVLELLLKINITSKEELMTQVLQNFFSLSIENQKVMKDFFKKYPYWGELDVEKKNLEEIDKRVTMLKENVNNLYEMYKSLEDYRSKKVFYAILKNWLYYDIKSLNQAFDSLYYPYFDLDIIPDPKNAIFVDLGAYIGDTIFNFLETYGIDSYQKIYAYEMTKDSFNSLQKNVEEYPNIITKQIGVSNFIGKGSILENKTSNQANLLVSNEKGDISITTLDEDIKEQIDILKMDIEGSELEALEGAINHIKNEKPKLLISIYHGYPDFIRIWKWVQNLNLNYHFYLRYYGTSLFPTEIVLFAI